MNSQPPTDVVEKAKAALEETCHCCDDDACGYQEMEFAAQARDLIPELVAEIERLRSAVGLHRMVITETPDDRWECCECCGADWPCPTAERIGADL